MRTLKNMMMGGGKMPEALIEYFKKKNKAAMGMKYQDGGEFLTKEEFDRIEAQKQREQGLPKPHAPRSKGYGRYEPKRPRH